MPTEEIKKKPVKRAAKAKKAEVESESVVSEEAVAAEAAKGGSFIPAIGRRKSAIARVRLIKNGKGAITVNGQPLEKYLPTYELQNIVKVALKTVGQETAVDISASVEGGGIHSQAEAIRLGISRALVVLNQTYRKTLKKLGFLTRDQRIKERKKPGLKKARRAPQWSKR
jgi:small subunit ribosomal protein S9